MPIYIHNDPTPEGVERVTAKTISDMERIVDAKRNAVSAKHLANGGVLYENADGTYIEVHESKSKAKAKFSDVVRLPVRADVLTIFRDGSDKPITEFPVKVRTALLENVGGHPIHTAKYVGWLVEKDKTERGLDILADFGILPKGIYNPGTWTTPEKISPGAEREKIEAQKIM